MVISECGFPVDKQPLALGVGKVTLHRFKLVSDPRGNLSSGEFPTHVPFSPKGYFLVYDVPVGKERGEHAHRQCHQFLICVRGSIMVRVNDGKKTADIHLDSPDKGLYLPPFTWSKQYNHSDDAVLLAFASDYYDAEDYIRNYEEFCRIISQQEAECEAFC